MALLGFLPRTPDLVVSGINRGANIGDDIIMSGTVAAAMAGVIAGVPGVAISCAGRLECGAVGLHRVRTLRRGRSSRISRAPASLPMCLLNVNVPELPAGGDHGRGGDAHRAAHLRR